MNEEFGVFFIYEKKNLGLFGIFDE